jgi:c-di-GMP-related signal transduction protein
MELLAETQHGDGNFVDEAFMTGIMSLMPALVGLPIRDIVAPLGIATEVRDALCEGRGPLGTLLQLVEATEGDEPAELARCLQAVGLDNATLNRCLAQALAWASNLHREADERESPEGEG